MKLTLLLTLVLSLFASSSSFAKCTYSADLSQVKVEWTAFKTTAKAPVKGRFKSIEVKGLKQANDLKKLVQSWKATVDVSSLETDNPARNTTLIESFFKKLKKVEITGKVKKFKGVEQGTFDFELTFGGTKKSIPMEFTFEIEKETRLHRMVAIGEMNISDFKANSALDSLNKACIDLHKGSDGVSKTWDDVKLNLSLPLDKECS